MRKVVIALIMVLPIIFVLILFSSVNLASVNVHVSVNGIKIYADGDPVSDGSALYVDMADMKDHTVTAQVTPANAYEKGYTLESDDTNILDISADGFITARSEGTAIVKATSNDKGFTASVPVVVTSSKAYDTTFTLYDGDGNAVDMNYNKNTSTYTVSEGLSVGTYTFKVDVFGGDSKDYSLTTENDPYGIRAVINEGEQSIMLPFSGSTTLKLEVDDAVVDGMINQKIRRTININVAAPRSDSGIVVNGIPDGRSVLLAKGATEAIVYVECDGEPQLTGDGIKSVRCLVHDGARAATGNCHKLEISLQDGIGEEELQATLSASSGSIPFKLSFAEFDFDLRSAVIDGADGLYNTYILKDTSTSVYAVPAVGLQGVEYVWTSNSDKLVLKPNASGSNCSFNASADGLYKVTVQAKRGGENLCEAKQLDVNVVTKVNSIWINNAVSDVDLAERYTLGGKKYAANGEVVANDSYTINIMVGKKNDVPKPNDFDNVEIISSDDEIAAIDMRDGAAYVTFNASGAFTITARWKYNDIFGEDKVQSIKLNLVKDAVEVANYSQLRAATESRNKVVLTKDIMLGTDDYGQPLPLPSRREIIEAQKYKSTYNVAWYAEKGNIANAQIAYAMEFKNDVYGNGFEINADYFANGVDASNTPQFFKGPLSFVALGEKYSAARVAAQDNCAFLIRTDGIKLYGVNLLGCSDDALYDENGEYALKLLNDVGTTLEVNADCDIINCRIRNGRNVVRVYGGNRNADHNKMSYYVNGVSSTDITDEDRIIVNIKGCIVTQGREFLIKAGANRAVKATRGNVQPELRNAQGDVYAETMKGIKVKDDSGNINDKRVGTNQYDGIQNDKFFYDRYVMTDLTIEDSVLETSGLFSIGVESNFAGEVLCEGSQNNFAEMLRKEGWANSGATSFASIVRLVGDVRMYDWKDVANVDSSSLIESADTDKFGKDPLQGILNFDLSAMLLEVDGQPEYAKLIYKTDDGKQFIHGGIAFYGGGRNYSMLDVSRLNGNLNNLTHMNINIEQFSTSQNDTTSKQTRLLPLAAGTHDFNFWMYTSDGTNNYVKQQSDAANGTKYKGVAKVELF